MRSSIIIVIIFFAVTLCSTKRYMNMESKTERFMEKAGDKSMNWLELIHQGDSIRGIFYGFDRMQNEKTIYFKSEMKHLTLSDEGIKFTLEDYILSEEPFDDGKEYKKYVVKDETSLPDLLKFHQKFSGIKTYNGIRLRRTSMMYDSKFDELNLMKVN
jgi:hypothetical protein